MDGILTNGAMAGQDLADVRLAAEDGDEVDLAETALFHHVFQDAGGGAFGIGRDFVFVLHSVR